MSLRGDWGRGGGGGGACSKPAAGPFINPESTPLRFCFTVLQPPLPDPSPVLLQARRLPAKLLYQGQAHCFCFLALNPLSPPSLGAPQPLPCLKLVEQKRPLHQGQPNIIDASSPCSFPPRASHTPSNPHPFHPMSPPTHNPSHPTHLNSTLLQAAAAEGPHPWRSALITLP